MSIANGSDRRIAYVAEATWGVTPATPSFKTLRSTGGGPGINKTTATSNEIYADRNVRNEILLGLDAAGAYNFEMAYNTFDDIFEAALFGTWTSNVLKNGSTGRSFTFEETLPIGDSAVTVSRFPGARISTLNLSIAARQPVTGSFGIMAQTEALPGGLLTGATYAAPTTNPISTASANVAILDFGLGGSAPAPKVRSLSLSVNNGLRVRPSVGNLFTEDFGLGDIDVTGNIEAYFETDDLYALALAHGSFATDFTVGNAATQRYRITMPNCRPMNPERRTGDNNDDVMVIIPFRAVLHTGEQCSIKMQRGVS
ncbi:hypothetical protein HNR00_003586 [Methylorubrum rhodinum]|uniref:Phage tail protein n=1 Tax=Methylorubrum rhodinum TaxID=29428 RepID=A0A840ZLF8_9HYPH|nr:phage tail tube protein [Methylorubrum rhodinum]MBB5758859.1 hypothetical protein [Methylorubrum rhodinum]